MEDEGMSAAQAPLLAALGPEGKASGPARCPDGAARA
jgi:hypothetical protein